MAFFKTIIISDVHLGTKDCKAKELAKFLKYNHCRRLILNGDIIDGWNLRRRGKWKKHDTRVFRRILSMIEHHGTEVIYVRGNHDDFLDKLLPVQIGNIKIVDHYEIKKVNCTYYVTHGDIFDVISTRLKWLAKIGDLGYKLLLWLNRSHNKRRALRGLPYDSVSQKMKGKVKLAVNFISDFEKVMVDYAKQKGYDGVICGHIHKPDNKMIDDVHYLNSGDWVETMSALVETIDGDWEVLYYDSLIPTALKEDITDFIKIDLDDEDSAGDSRGEVNADTKSAEPVKSGEASLRL